MIGELISAGASLLGGMFNRDAQKDANQANREMAEKNIQLQREFAQSGVQWKVADAKAAGVHPLFALGANTHSFSPVSVGAVAESGMGDGISRAGQSLGRAVQSSMTQSDRAVTQTMQALQLERAGLENELLRSQITNVNRATNPAQPSASQRWLVDGQGQTAVIAPGVSGPGDLIKVEPMKRTATDPGRPWSEPGAIPDVGYARTTTGLAPVPSQNVKERIEDNMIQEFMWALRNNLLPTIGFNQTPPSAPVPKGYDVWQFNPLTQEYQPMREPKWMGRFGKYFRY